MHDNPEELKVPQLRTLGTGICIEEIKWWTTTLCRYIWNNLCMVTVCSH
jgi:hypothetical protein